MPHEIENRLDKIIEDIHQLPEEATRDLYLRFERHSYAARIEAQHHIARTVGSNSCGDTWIMVISGHDETGGAGTVDIRIDKRICPSLSTGELHVLLTTPQFVALPLSSAPTLLTHAVSTTEVNAVGGYFLRRRNGSNPGFYIEASVRVMGWKLDGQPAARLPFSWVCTVEVGVARMIDG